MEYFLNEIFYYKENKARVIQNIICKNCIFQDDVQWCTRPQSTECSSEYRNDHLNVIFKNINLSRF